MTKHDPTEKDDVPESPSKRHQARLPKIATVGDKLISPKVVLTPEQTKAFEAELTGILKKLESNHKEFEALQKKTPKQLAEQFKSMAAFHDQAKKWHSDLEPKPSKDDNHKAAHNEFLESK